jgi:hypothetical protein
MDYRALYVDLVGRYHWPPEGPRRESAWDDVRLLLLEKIRLELRIDLARSHELGERLVARVGLDWYRPGRMEDVARLLEEV